MRAGFSYNLIIIIIGGGFGIIIIKVRHCWLRERKKQSHQKRVLVYLSFFFFFFFKCQYFILCFSYYVVGTVPIELVMNLFLKKTKTSVIDFYIFFCFVFLLSSWMRTDEISSRVPCGSLSNPNKTIHAPSRLNCPPRKFFFLPTFVRVTTNEYGNLYL